MRILKVDGIYPSAENVRSGKALAFIDHYMGKGESILVVDDVKEQKEIATKILKKLGYSVLTVSSGEESVFHQAICNPLGLTITAIIGKN